MKLSKTDIKLIIAAIIETRRRHQQAIDTEVTYEDLKWDNYDSDCALCQAHFEIRRSYPSGTVGNCCGCPWKIMFGTNCMSNKDHNYHNSEDSIIRLNDWERHFVTQLEKIS